MRVSDGPDGEAYCTNCYRQRLGENLEIEDTMIHPLLIFDGTQRTCVWQGDQLLDKDEQVRGRQPQTSWGWKHNIDLSQVLLHQASFHFSVKSEKSSGKKKEVLIVSLPC